MGPVHEFGPGPLSQNFVENLVGTWPRRTILRHIDYDGDISTDDHYKEWIQLQQTGKDKFIRLRCNRKEGDRVRLWLKLSFSLCKIMLPLMVKQYVISI